MKNLRYVITVLALVNFGFAAQAASTTKSTNTVTSGTGYVQPMGSKISVGVE